MSDSNILKAETKRCFSLYHNHMLDTGTSLKCRNFCKLDNPTVSFNISKLGPLRLNFKDFPLFDTEEIRDNVKKQNNYTRKQL